VYTILYILYQLSKNVNIEYINIQFKRFFKIFIFFNENIRFFRYHRNLKIKYAGQQKNDLVIYAASSFTSANVYKPVVNGRLFFISTCNACCALVRARNVPKFQRWELYPWNYTPEPLKRVQGKSYAVADVFARSRLF